MTSKILLTLGVIIALTFAALPANIKKEFNNTASLTIDFKTSTNVATPLTAIITLINADKFHYTTGTTPNEVPGTGGSAYAVCGVLPDSKTMTAGSVAKGFVIGFECAAGNSFNPFLLNISHFFSFSSNIISSSLISIGKKAADWETGAGGLSAYITEGIITYDGINSKFTKGTQSLALTVSNTVYTSASTQWVLTEDISIANIYNLNLPSSSVEYIRCYFTSSADSLMTFATETTLTSPFSVVTFEDPLPVTNSPTTPPPSSAFVYEVSAMVLVISMISQLI